VSELPATMTRSFLPHDMPSGPKRSSNESPRSWCAAVSSPYPTDHVPAEKRRSSDRNMTLSSSSCDAGRLQTGRRLFDPRTPVSL